MAASQIPSSITILNSLHGFQSVSLTEFDTSALSSIAAGSVVEIAGAFFNFAGDETILLWASVETATTAYIALAPSGTAGSQIATASFTPTAPAWRDDLQGWYASAGSTTRVIGSLYKTSSTAQARKYIYGTIQSEREQYNWRGHIERITSGSGNWTVPDRVYKIRVTCVGGGGNGGAGNNYAGGGGGGTNISLVLGDVLDVIPGDTKAYSVGAAETQTTFTGATTGAPGGRGAAGGSSSAYGYGGLGAAGGAGAGGGPGEGGLAGAGGAAGGIGGNVSAGRYDGTAGGYGGGGGGGVISGSGGAGGSGIIIIEY